MSVLGRKKLCVLGAVLGGLSCCGGGGGTTPPGPPVDLLKNPAGDNQSWYFNNPLPTALSVTAVDVDGRAVPGVVVTWAVTTPNGGGVNPPQSTTNGSGVATTADSIGAVTLQNVTATFTGLSGPVTFASHATTPPNSGAVNVGDNFFNPASVIVQVNSTVTWTWTGQLGHSVTFTGGADSGVIPTGTFQQTFTTVGTKSYFCKVHQNMTGTVTVVH